jgi:hypothetical protein
VERAHLHVTSGDSAAGSLLRARLCARSAILSHRDVLACGPLGPLQSLESWRTERGAYWDQLLEEIGYELRRGAWAEDGDRTQDLWQGAEALRTAETVTVWLGRALSDQLMLAFLLQLAELVPFDAGRLRVVQFDQHARNSCPVLGVGEVGPEEVARHPPAAPLSLAALGDLRALWAAVTAPAPWRLLAFLQAPGDQSVLESAAARLLGRFPDVHSGLPRWETVLLHHVGEEWTTAARVLGATLGHSKDLDCVGDLYLFHRLVRLARAPGTPLVALDRWPPSLRHSRVRLTAAGRDVMAGRANAVALNGVDDWVGGIHLDSAAGRLWLQDGDALIGP